MGVYRSRAMTWIHRGRNLSFFKCQKECNRRGFDIWGLQYAVGPGKSGQCMCAHESQKHKWGKYGGANNCTWDRNTGVYVGGGWSMQYIEIVLILDHRILVLQMEVRGM